LFNHLPVSNLIGEDF